MAKPLTPKTKRFHDMAYKAMLDGDKSAIHIANISLLRSHMKLMTSKADLSRARETIENLTWQLCDLADEYRNAA